VQKNMEPEDFARILAAKCAGDPPEVFLQIANERNLMILDGPYIRVDVDLDSGLVTLVKDTNIVGEAFAALIDQLVDAFRGRRSRR